MIFNSFAFYGFKMGFPVPDLLPPPNQFPKSQRFLHLTWLPLFLNTHPPPWSNSAPVGCKWKCTSHLAKVARCASQIPQVYRHPFPKYDPTLDTFSNSTSNITCPQSLRRGKHFFWGWVLRGCYRFRSSLMWSHRVRRSKLSLW
jgi:hypothetical protein